MGSHNPLAFRKPATPGALFVTGDHQAMHRDGHLKWVRMLRKPLEPYAENGAMRLKSVEIRSGREFEQWRAFAAARVTRYDACCILAHGSPQGVQAAPDLSLSWSEVGNALAPLEPRLLLAVSCYGGLGTTADALFSAIPSLNTILGCPGTLTADDAFPAVLDFTSAAMGHDIDWSLFSCVLGPLFTDNILFRRTRAGHQASTPMDRALQDLLGSMLKVLLGDGSSHLDRGSRPRASGCRPPGTARRPLTFEAC